ncbi:hypothetical protein PsYK624_124990 [Phanerochaete sordida]|uniref:Uncharacterized protein n=1 Tax=Phanerochaete sordida TaxID=48140 RepID=A0A9P3GJI1_9APHY|nr:hypothetical protein PsYK624_124990 [Phanerochaete sordida]
MSPPPPEESSKFKMRKAKVRQLEREQELEDASHLGMTAAEHALLQATFTGVRPEFEDLDGLSWEEDAAQEMLREWKRKKFFEIVAASRQRQGLPVLGRAPSLRRSKSSSLGRSSSGFTMPLLTRARPSIPGTLLDPPDMTSQTKGPRIAPLLVREGSRTQYGDKDEEDWLDDDGLDWKVSTAIRKIEVVGDAPEDDEPTKSVKECVTLGRSWRGGAKTRSAIPAPFLTVRARNHTRGPSILERYIESGGQDADLWGKGSGPSESASGDEQATVRGKEVGKQDCRSHDPLDDAPSWEDDTSPDYKEENQRSEALQELTASTETTASVEHNLPQPPPIVVASPRMGSSANLWGLHSGGTRNPGSPTLGSPRLGRERMRNGVVGNPGSPRAVSFHRDRCGIQACRSGRRRCTEVLS